MLNLLKMESVGSDYIISARRLAKNGSYGKAIDLYLIAFERNELLKDLHEPEFRAVMVKQNELLAAAERIEELVNNFGRAMNAYPNNIHIKNEIGKCLLKFGYYEEAWNQFQKALAIDAGFVNAEKNLNSVKNLMVERWHFRMLNDKIRNNNYRAAILEKVVPCKSRVFDIGTGTGLLSMYAAEGNPKAIVACDSSEVMTNLSDYILEENRLLFAITVHNKMSTEMTLSDVGEKCSLLITELFDAGLFGEHILQSLFHAHENLLEHGAEVIPQKAEFFIMGVDSKLLNSKYQLNPEIKPLLAIGVFNVHVIANKETYDCDDVYLYKDLKYITEPRSVIKVDFTDANDVNHKLNNSEPYVVELRAKESGNINSYIGWFKLQLTENISITTDPRDENRATAWQQAVFFDSIPRNVRENDTFNIEFFLKSERLSMKQDIAHDTENYTEILRISPETMRFLNDSKYMELITNCVGAAYIYLGQITDMTEVNIVDLCPFPLFGFLMLKRGINSLVCYGKDKYDQDFIKTVFGINGIDMHKVTILHEDSLSIENFGSMKYHIVFINTIELCGDIDLPFRDVLLSLKKDNMVDGGLIMPSTAVLMGQIVKSKCLDITNRVYDENLGYKVANHINKFQVSQNISLDFTHLEYTPLTDPIVIGNCLNIKPDVLNVPITHDGDANAIITWYNIQVIDDLGEISTNREYSFVDSIAFLANPTIPMVSGNIANIICCVDNDGSFKLIIDDENT